jgi:hypothetical protein
MLKRNSMMIFGASMLAISSAYAGGDPNATNEDTVQNQNAGATTEQSSTSAASSASASGSTSQTSASASDSSRSGAQSGSGSQAGSGGQAVAQNSGYEGFDAVEDDELVIDTESLADGDGMGSIQVQWQISADGANWRVLPGAIQSSFTPRDSEVGKFLRVQVSYLDGQGNTEILTSPPSKAVQNVNDAPIGIPILTGQAIEDGALIVDVSRISDEDGLGAFSLIWQRSSKRTNWENFPDQFGQTIQLSQSDVGFSYRAVVSYIDGFGTKETLVTEASETVANVDNPLTGEVTIRGSEQEGAELVANTSSLSDYDGIASINLNWELSSDGRTWSEIDGTENIRSLQLGQPLVGSLIRAKATVVDNFGAEYVVMSKPTNAIKNVNDKPAGNIFIRRISN